MPPPPPDISAGFHDPASALFAAAGQPGPATALSAIPLQRVYSPLYSDNQRRSPARRAALGSDRIPRGCSLGDRFDRDNALAYNFSDGQSRIGLGIRMEGIGIDAVRLQFRYKFQPIKGRKEKCRYESGWQGLAGSAYNELFRREHDTVWREIEDRGLDFWK